MLKPPKRSASAALLIFLLYTVAGNKTGDSALPGLIALFDSTSSVLLRHEVAYALGQMQRVDAVPFLAKLLRDPEEDPITRHEAAEALGAIEAPESLEILAQHAADASSEVSETCGLALAQLNYKIEKGACGCERRPMAVIAAEEQQTQTQQADTAADDAEPLSATASTGPPAADGFADVVCERPPPAESTAPSYTYVSPAPAAKAAPLPMLRAQLLDADAALFERYRALFALRDAVPKEGPAAVEALCACLRRSDDSALLKHEIAFVLGQLEHPAAAGALCEAVRREGEHGMVRHEAAEALGALGTPEAVEVLRAYATHEEEILRESCWVALMWLE